MYKHFSHMEKKTKTKKNKSQKHMLTSINHSTIIQNTANVTKLKFKIFQNKIPPASSLLWKCENSTVLKNT